jgi:hypothetical protein
MPSMKRSMPPKGERDAPAWLQWVFALVIEPIYKVFSFMVHAAPRFVPALSSVLRWPRDVKSKSENGESEDFAVYTDHDAAPSERLRASVRDDRPDRRKRERLVVGVMAHEFEKNLGLSTIALFVALALVGGYAMYSHDRTMLTTSIVIGVLFFFAVLRQAILMWRTRKGYFGSSEHEVRELLAFAMRHPTPEDFYDDNGHILPAFDVAFRESRRLGYVGVLAPGHL